jgi:hypothetical protein
VSVRRRCVIEVVPKCCETYLRGGLDGCPACPGRLDIGKVRVAVPRVLSRQKKKKERKGQGETLVLLAKHRGLEGADLINEM